MSNELIKKDAIGNYLEKMTPSIQRALPTHQLLSQYVRAIETAVRKNPKLQQALKDDPSAFGACIVDAAQLGLPIGMRNQASLVPFKNGKTGKLECTLICGYEGLLDLAYRSDRIESIMAEVVCKNDEFDYEMGANQRLIHKPKINGTRGAPYAAYAVAKFKGDGAGTVFVVLGKDEIEKVRKASPGARSSDSPWNNWPEEMWKKTAIKRLCKIIPKSTELRQALQFEHKMETEAVREVDSTVISESNKALASELGKKMNRRRQEDEAMQAMNDEAEAQEQELIEENLITEDIPIDIPEDEQKSMCQELDLLSDYRYLYGKYTDDDQNAVLIDSLLQKRKLKPLPQITPQDIDQNTAAILKDVANSFAEEIG